jgi:phosphatidylglycerophosphate synthase
LGKPVATLTAVIDVGKFILKLHTVGQPREYLFGMRSDEHMTRQIRQADEDRFGKHAVINVGVSPGLDLAVVAAADVTASNVTLGWLLGTPGEYLTDSSGRALMVAVSESEVASAMETIGHVPGSSIDTVESGSIDVFVRRLRRREPVELLDLRELPRSDVERRLFDLVYKGITDVVTRYVWPTPAFHLVRLCAALKISPNAVTLVGILLVVVATICFLQGAWLEGLLAGWVMTFLDTVDGKLARTTGTSSELGSSLDHLTDVIHPPIWWICVAVGALPGLDLAAQMWMLVSSIVIVASYIVGRFSESRFKRRFGFNQFLWRPFDSRLRLIIARRNTNLLFLSVGAALGAMPAAFHAMAVWSAVSLGAQAFRYRQAMSASRRDEVILNWLETTPEVKPLPKRKGSSEDDRVATDPDTIQTP